MEQKGAKEANPANSTLPSVCDTGRPHPFAPHDLGRTHSPVFSLKVFLLAAILALIYTFWAFGVSIIKLPTFPMLQQPGQVARATIEFVSGLLLVLIIVEMLGTVIHYLQVHTTSLRPFLFISIVSATRSILSIGARLSIEGFNLRAT